MLTMLGLSHDRTHALKAPAAWTDTISSAPARVVSSSRARCLGLTSGTPVPHQPRRGWRWGTPDAFQLTDRLDQSRNHFLNRLVY